MAYQVVLPNFSKGEIAPVLYGRIDTNQYNSGLRKARNFIVQRYGGVTFRPGTRVVGKALDPALPLRLAPFQFSIDQAYVLILHQGLMQLAAFGGYVIEQNTKITAATQSNPCVLTIPFHGYAVADRLFLSGIVGMTELNGRTVTVISVPNVNQIEIDVDSSGFTAFVSSDGDLNTAPPPPLPTPPIVPPVVDPPAPPDVGSGDNAVFEPVYFIPPVVET